MGEVIAQLPTLSKALGEKHDEARVKRWRKGVGDRVKKGDRVVDLETESAVVMFEAELNGFIAQLFAEKGDLLQAGDPIFSILPESEEAPAQAPWPRFPYENSEWTRS